MRNLPTGTITFLFTDIEGSTVLWEQFPETMHSVVARHDELLYSIMQDNGGIVFKTVGDAFYVVFRTAGEALTAAVKAQRALAIEPWPEQITSLRTRMALHTGEAESRGNDYFGQSLNRVARILSAGHGGQVLLSQTTVSLLHKLTLPGVSLQDLGEHRLKDIQHHEHIFQLVFNDLPSTFPPLKTLDRHPNNLPTQLTPFVGREKDLNAVSSLLKQDYVRLVTLTGPGGVGKTRLSLQVAANLTDSFTDGVYFVELETVREANAIAPVIAKTLRIPDSGDQQAIDLLQPSLKGRILLVLDNFEQIIEAAPLLLELLIGCHQLKILVTSRAALLVSGEYEYYIAPLLVPVLKPPFKLAELAQNEAVSLFIQRARTVKPDFQLTLSNGASIAAICAELDGLPLAIELAAARINLLPPQALLKRIGQRFKLLIGGERNRSARQQTLRGAITWSYELLDTHEKTLFEQLSIFTEGCLLEAIEAICPVAEDSDHDLLDTLYSLINKSLLLQQEQENGEPRFVLLHSIRGYALEQLQKKGEMESLQQRYATYYLDLAEQAASSYTGPEQRQWQARLEQEQANLQAALHWFIERNQIEPGLRMAGALWPFWLTHGHLQEHYASLEKLLAANATYKVAISVRAKALEGASRLTLRLNKRERAAAFAEEMLQLGQTLDDKEMIGNAYVMQADIAMRLGNHQQAVELLEQSLQIRRSLNDSRGMAGLLNNLGNLALGQGQLERAAAFHEKSLALLREIGDERAIARILNHLGKVELLREHYEQATILYEESIRRFRKQGDAQGTATTLFSLGMVAFCQNNFARAIDLYQNSLTQFRDLDDQAGIAICLREIAQIACIWQQFERATRLLAQAQLLNKNIRESSSPLKQPEKDDLIETLHHSLDNTLFKVLWETGNVMTLEEAITEALMVKLPEN
ncbi:adenylate/guanylate cyclase domain-containing protein [Ktedonosporobacter rubrisoli]|uniref:Adenylate/guanylate cyclase domain-containing protein n=1 Tax=Ktedonosporobacter rubrisoli TaxID=2509675 RepID=A0A4P6JQ18_KTERU|nr:tetratricopeptide repeat protein [Ktedonosporobacter rubrisoli]QBD77489.1 adenylate/guanylate cyclase domain-containing protein [Ktedonosporobacter rubrisoli]